MIITIDGPSGSGKSTVAKALAQKLNIAYFDSGAMYRSVAWLAVHFNVDPKDVNTLIRLYKENPPSIKRSGGVTTFFMGSYDVTAEIRTRAVTAVSSEVAAFPEVRALLLDLQRSFAKDQSVVFEGRDMGTKVFPSADVKFFLTSNAAVRAQRRYKELQEKSPKDLIGVTVGSIQKEIEERDYRDTTREHSPLVQAENALLVDTSALSIEQVVAKLYQHVLSWRSKLIRKGPLFYRFGRRMCKIYFQLFHHFRCYGAERCYFGPAIIAPNHVSFFDPPFVGSGWPAPLCFFARETLFKNKWFGKLLLGCNTFPLKRQSDKTDGQVEGTNRRAFVDMMRWINEGRQIVLFPEGARSPTGELMAPQAGIYTLVEKTGCALIPIYIGGSYEAWGKGKKIKPFTKMWMVIGKPIHPHLFEGLPKQEARQKMLDLWTQKVLELKAWSDTGCQGDLP